MKAKAPILPLPDSVRTFLEVVADSAATRKTLSAKTRKLQRHIERLEREHVAATRWSRRCLENLDALVLVAALGLYSPAARWALAQMVCQAAGIRISEFGVPLLPKAPELNKAMSHTPLGWLT